MQANLAGVRRRCRHGEGAAAVSAVVDGRQRILRIEDQRIARRRRRVVAVQRGDGIGRKVGDHNTHGILAGTAGNRGRGAVADTLNRDLVVAVAAVDIGGGEVSGIFDVDRIGTVAAIDEKTVRGVLVRGDTKLEEVGVHCRD